MSAHTSLYGLRFPLLEFQSTWNSPFQLELVEFVPTSLHEVKGVGLGSYRRSVVALTLLNHFSPSISLLYSF